MKKLKRAFVAGITFLPMLALAAGTNPFTTLMGNLTGIVKWAVPVLIAVATAYFIWGVIGYITSGGDEGKRGEARQTMIYGVIGLFVIVSIWGLVGVLRDFTGVGDETTIPTIGIPTIPTS